MFSDFRPERDRIEAEQKAAIERNDLLIAARAEMYARAAVVADQYIDGGGVDELCAVDYRAARERFDEAARVAKDGDTERLQNATIHFLRHVHPSRLKLIPGWQIGADS